MSGVTGDPSRVIWSVVADHCCCANWEITSRLEQGVASLGALLLLDDRASGRMDQIETCPERALQEELGRRCLQCGMRCVAVGKEKVLQSSMDRQSGVAGLHG